jgi:hypothetical protein
LPAPVSVNVKAQVTGVAIEVTGMTTVPAVGLVIVVTSAFAMPSIVALVISEVQAPVSAVYVPPGAFGLDTPLEYVLSETVAPYWKLEPSKAAVTEPVAFIAEGLTFSRPFPTVKFEVPEVPPSVFDTTTWNVPGVAAAPPDGFVGVTLRTIEVELTEVTDDVKDVPSVALVNETVAPVRKPEPVMVTVVAGVASQTEAGLIVVMTGVASVVIASATDALGPLASVRTAEHVDAAVPDALKLAVAVVEDVSVKSVKVTVPATQVAANPTPIVAPLSAKLLPVMVAVPVALAPMVLVVAP